MRLRKESLSAWMLLLVLIFVFTLLPDDSFAESTNSTRLFGKDRYETAVEISKKGWETSKFAVLARGDDFPDALCAGPLAKKYNAPILLTDTNKLNAIVLSELKRLGVANALIVGGIGAVSENVESALISQGINVERISGSDRYETSVKIAEKVGTSSRVALATGDNFPDALSISAIAAGVGMPILLTEKSYLPERVRQYISSRDISKTYVIGGRGVISDGVMEFVPGGERIFGTNRFETNAAVMDKFASDLKFNNVFLAVADGPNGDEFADALSGSVLAAKSNSPVVLVYKSLSPVIEGFIKPKMSRESMVTALGGQAVVPPSIIEEILNLDKRSVYIKTINPPSAIRVGENRTINIEADPGNAEISAYSSNPLVMSANVSGKSVVVTGISQGTAVITITAKLPGFSDGVTSLVITPPVYNVTKDRYYGSIQGAIDLSSSGDTIRIEPAVYNEHIVVTKNNLKIIGVDRDSTIIDASQNGKVTKAGIKLQNVSGIEIKNLTVKNSGVNLTYESSREPYGIYVKNSDKNLFENLKLKEVGEYGVYLYDGCDLNIVQNCTIDGSRFIDDGYCALDGIFASGGESGKSSMNTGNKFVNNKIKKVVFGISLTASENTLVSSNDISSSDCTTWSSSVSAGVVLSNSGLNIVEKNTITGAQYGIRLSTLSSLSPYSYGGSPDSNKISGNNIAAGEHGIRVTGSGNIVENNSLIGNNKGSGIWLNEAAKWTSVMGNVLANNDIAILVDNASNQAQFNKFLNNGKGVKNNTDTTFNALSNYWGDGSPSGSVFGSVAYSPWLTNGDDSDTNTPGFQAARNMTWGVSGSLIDAVNSAANGDTLKLSKNTYTIDKQLYINKDLNIVGESREDTVIKIGFDTLASDTDSGAIFVAPGKRLNIKDITIDGSGNKVMDAIRTYGYGTIESVAVRSIGHDGQNGYGINAFGSANITIKGSVFSGIKKDAVGVYDNAIVTIGGDGDKMGNTFNGGSEGNFVQYGVRVIKGNGNPQVTVKNNTFSGYSGINSTSSWSSGGIGIEYGASYISGNTFDTCPESIKVWTGSWVNGTPVDSGNAIAVGGDLGKNNTFKGNIERKVVIYDSSGTPVYYLVPGN